MLVSRLAAAAAGLCLVVSGVLAPNAFARPISPAEERTLEFSGDLPLCDDIGIMSALKDQFDSKQFWFGDDDLTIASFEPAVEVGFRKHGADFIPRRYCEVNAMFNDGRAREVKYNIIEGGGFAGFGPGVEFCAVGQDKAHAYPPHCSGAVR
jgi:hypothetical protein